MEARWQNYSDEQLEGIQIINLLGEEYLTKDFMPDATKIVDQLRNIRQLISQLKINTIIFDGISSIRKYAVEYWCKEQGRKQPANPGDWGRINAITNECIFPLIMFCRTKGINLIMTSLMKEIYENDKPSGIKTLDCPDHIKAQSDAIYVSQIEGDQFYLYVHKHQIMFDPNAQIWTFQEILPFKEGGN